MTRRKTAARLLLAAALSSVALAAVPAPATTAMYCPPENPACIPIILACQTLQTAHNKVTKLPECNLM